jgi:D-beta-D-heptose 7-phosphate kinase/D-beta-D-heptose 1-phosphate adenosyltransferase
VTGPSGGPTSGLVTDLAGAAHAASEFRSRGERVVFTNGCFDLLHVGHLALLEEAAAQGDRLVVAVNDDASVRRLKGPSRPLTPGPERMRLLAAFRVVDVVLPFAEDTPLRAIEAVRPDVLVKGADWTEDAIVGAREVRGWGGRIHRVTLVPDRSTSRLAGGREEDAGEG